MNEEARRVPAFRAGSGILFLNPNSAVLLALRDDKPEIPFPNCWDIPGGMLEPGETPEQCVVREMQEEINTEIKNPTLFRVYHSPDRADYVFWQRANFDLATLELHEGQRLKWFIEAEIVMMPAEEFAFGFKPVILEFFRSRVFADQAQHEP